MARFGVEPLCVMAPKVEPTLPSTRHFVRGTYVPHFSTFGFWATLQFMLEILFSGRQTEQLFRPGETFPTNMELARSILFPGMAPQTRATPRRNFWFWRRVGCNGFTMFLTAQLYLDRRQHGRPLCFGLLCRCRLSNGAWRLPSVRVLLC